MTSGLPWQSPTRHLVPSIQTVFMTGQHTIQSALSYSDGISWGSVKSLSEVRWTITTLPYHISCFSIEVYNIFPSMASPFLSFIIKMITLPRKTDSIHQCKTNIFYGILTQWSFFLFTCLSICISNIVS